MMETREAKSMSLVMAPDQPQARRPARHREGKRPQTAREDAMSLWDVCCDQLVWASTERFCSSFTRKKKACAMKEEPLRSQVNKHTDAMAIKRVREGYVEAFG